MNHFDVIVIGLGGMGSAAAYQLARRGKRVLGLERHTPAHNKGSSHGKSRVIRLAYFEHPAYVPLLLRAYELWEQLERESNQHLLTITGGLMMGLPGSETVRGSLLSAQTHGLEHEMLDARDIRRRYPPMSPSGNTVALYEPRAGFVHPEKSVSAHLQRAAELGAELHFQEPATSWRASPSADRVIVSTEKGNYEAGKLVICPGAWASQVLGDLRLPLAVERQVLYWFDPVGGVKPFQPDRFPIYIWEAEDTTLFYGFPHQPGEPPGGVKVAFFYHGGQACSPDTVDRQVQDIEVQRMRHCIVDRIPSLNGPLLGAATCLYTLTPDHHFIIARHPRHHPVLIASPCSGHGYKFCSVVGEILADLAIDGRPRLPIELFSIDRFLR
jgi:sarcosine oxidase